MKSIDVAVTATGAESALISALGAAPFAGDLAVAFEVDAFFSVGFFATGFLSAFAVSLATFGSEVFEAGLFDAEVSTADLTDFGADFLATGFFATGFALVVVLSTLGSTDSELFFFTISGALQAVSLSDHTHRFETLNPCQPLL